MIRVWSDPHPKYLKTKNNGILQVILNLARELPAFGFEYSDTTEGADLFVRHAGAQGSHRDVHVTHNHGLLPTAMRQLGGWAWGVNAEVAHNLVCAREITVPSDWVAETIRRDMRTNPHIIHWGIDPHLWRPGSNEGFVLWAKGREGDVCETEHIMKLAELAPSFQFVSTFGERRPNLRVIGAQRFEEMKAVIHQAGAYLATTRETFGIQTLEAMACGVPVLGFNWAATPDIVIHKETGYLAQPGDYMDLLEGLNYIKLHRPRLSEAARERALTFTWEKTAEQISRVYKRALEPHYGPTASIVIPCYNYEQYVSEAITSALMQQGVDFEVIVVNDASTDNSRAVIDQYAERLQAFHLEQNGGVANARNFGAKQARGKYIAFLDADDRLEQGWLKATVTELDKNQRAGIAYTALQMNKDDKILRAGWPPVIPDIRLQLRGGNGVPTCCLIRKEAFDRAGGYRSRFEPTEDAELWLKIAECGYDYVCASVVPLFTYRIGHASLSRGVKLPPYMDFHVPTKAGQPPFAALGKQGKGSWPVRDYDQPVICAIIKGNEGRLIDTLDCLLAQSFRFWETTYTGRQEIPSGYPFVKINTNPRAPLILELVAGELIDPYYFERELRAWQHEQPSALKYRE